MFKDDIKSVLGKLGMYMLLNWLSNEAILCVKSLSLMLKYAPLS